MALINNKECNWCYIVNIKTFSLFLFLLVLIELISCSAPSRFILPYILQCFAQSTWRHCGFLRQHNIHAFANVPGFVCSSIFFLAMCGSICSLMPLCKCKEWATWAGNRIPMMHHAARYSSSSTKLALWKKGSVLTITVNVVLALMQFAMHCNISFILFYQATPWQ